jgi:hypothetical protein
MTTPAQGNLSELAAKAEAGFESSGLSPDEADRLAASFKPSWEFDEAPFTQSAALPHADLEALEGGGVNSDVRGNLHHPDSERSHTVAPHVPPQRMETSEPENSVIIDRSITAGDMEARGQVHANGHAPASLASPFALPPQLVAQAVGPHRVVAPVARSRMNADESLELPASLKKSNKGLFIGLGLAAAAAVLVFAVRAMTSSASDEPAATPAATAAAAPPVDTSRSAIPIPPVPPPPAVAAAPASPPVASPPATPTPPPSPPAYAGHTFAQQTPKPMPHAAPPHHAAPAPRAPAAPKQTGGGIVRDNPF